MPRITIRINEDLYHVINEKAKNEQESRSSIAKTLILEGLNKKQSKTVSQPSIDKISLEINYLLKKLMYEHFEYTQSDFDKVRDAIKRKIQSTQLSDHALEKE